MVDRLDMRGSHEKAAARPDEVALMIDEDPAIMSLDDKPSSRNTRWFAEVHRVKELLAAIDGKLTPSGKRAMPKDMSLAELFKEYRRVRDKLFDGGQQDQVSDLIDGRMDELHGGISACKKLLENMKHEIAEFTKSVGPDYDGSEVKMRTTMHGALCRRLHRLAKQFQALQIERREMAKKTMLEEVKTLFRGERGTALPDEVCHHAVQPSLARPPARPAAPIWRGGGCVGEAPLLLGMRPGLRAARWGGGWQGG
jgi:hypothetical protein